MGEHEHEEESLYNRIGGEVAIRLVVQEFYSRVRKDDELAPFFEDVNMQALRAHQRAFLQTTFTQIEETIDANDFIFQKHKHLFAYGLHEYHFDLVASHLIGALRHLEVSQELIDEAIDRVAPFRRAFEIGASGYGPKKEPATLYDRLGGEVAIHGVIDEMHRRIQDDDALRPFFQGANLDHITYHQRALFKVAFSDNPGALDIPELVYDKHTRLFREGLNAYHFDLLIKHLKDAFIQRGASKSLVDQAIEIIEPLRAIFVAGSKKFEPKVPLKRTSISVHIQ